MRSFIPDPTDLDDGWGEGPTRLDRYLTCMDERGESHGEQRREENAAAERREPAAA